MVPDPVPDLEQAHAVDPFAVDPVAGRLPGKVGDGRVALQRGAHAVEVVLDQKENRQAPERGEIHRLAEVAGVRGTVTEHADRDAVFLPVLRGEGQPGGERQVAADDSVAAHEAALGVEDVHRTTPAATGACFLAEQLGHDLVCRGTPGQGVAVGAVGTDQVVVLAHHRGGAHDRRFLADRQVEETAGLCALVLTPGFLLEAPDQAHPAQ